MIFFIPAPYREKCTGQEGFEPSTSGFGDRRSTIRATGLGSLLLYLGLFVEGVLLVPRAVLAELELFLGVLSILLGRIIAALALGALERDKFNGRFLGSHNCSLSLVTNKK
jgi:hypothetical protein